MQTASVLTGLKADLTSLIDTGVITNPCSIASSSQHTFAGNYAQIYLRTYSLLDLTPTMCQRKMFEAFFCTFVIFILDSLY